ncbi:MAG: PDGLE domain-containing protein [Candidatus Eisenbacteria bacterium]
MSQIVNQTPGRKRTLPMLLLLSLGLAILVSPFACKFPDGLEKVAETLGFIDREGAVIGAPIADYSLPVRPAGRLAGAAAGGVGVAIVFAGAVLVGKLTTRRTAGSSSGRRASE